MGAFMIFDIGFKTYSDRSQFEKVFDIKKGKILVDDKSNSYGFSAWIMKRNPGLNPIYDFGFMGYEEPKTILKKCLSNGIDIKFFAYIPINDRNSHWVKLKGRW